MPFLVLLTFSTAVGIVVTFAARRYPTASGAPPPMSDAAGRALRREASRHAWVARLLRGRLDPEAATGLALTIALVVAVAGGIVIGALAYLTRSNARLVDLDVSVGEWGARNATAWSTNLIQVVTDLGDTPVTIAVIAGVLVVELIRAPNRWILPFLLTAVIGEIVLVNTVKELLDRVRPTFNPIAETLGPSFPSGHSARAAVLYAAVALVVSRRRSPRARAAIAGIAVAIAVAVACSRVMLGVHWLSDVIAGLAFGWAWFSVCAIAFGGRFLVFGATVERAQHVANRA